MLCSPPQTSVQTFFFFFFLFRTSRPSAHNQSGLMTHSFARASGEIVTVWKGHGAKRQEHIIAQAVAPLLCKKLAGTLIKKKGKKVATRGMFGRERPAASCHAKSPRKSSAVGRRASSRPAGRDGVLRLCVNVQTLPLCRRFRRPQQLVAHAPLFGQGASWQRRK